MTSRRSEEGPSPGSLPSHPKHRCTRIDCDSDAHQRCSGCKNAWYCSPKCQKYDWKWHASECKSKAGIRSSRRLLQACFDNLVPLEHPKTMEDFGFNKAGRRCGGLVLGVYQGLNSLCENSLSPRNLEQWLKSGTLAQHIEAKFEALPVQNRGGYYPWFQKHRWVFDGSRRPGGRQMTADQDAETSRKLWVHLGGQRESQLHSWSQQQKICLELYYLLFTDFHAFTLDTPELYIHFGFCTARNEQEEEVLKKLYNALIWLCTFEEFCEACASSSLLELFERKAVITPDDVRPTLPRHFEHVVSFPWETEDGPVWNLKQYLFGDIGVPMTHSVVAEYAFINCRSPQEIDALADTYRTAFGHLDFDELELHMHCTRRTLYEYLSKFQTLPRGIETQLDVPMIFLIPRFH